VRQGNHTVKKGDRGGLGREGRRAVRLCGVRGKVRCTEQGAAAQRLASRLDRIGVVYKGTTNPDSMVEFTFIKCITM
jgi:hypothetical protein